MSIQVTPPHLIKINDKINISGAYESWWKRILIFLKIKKSINGIYTVISTTHIDL